MAVNAQAMSQLGSMLGQQILTLKGLQMVESIKRKGGVCNAEATSQLNKIGSKKRRGSPWTIAKKGVYYENHPRTFFDWIAKRAAAKKNSVKQGVVNFIKAKGEVKHSHFSNRGR